MKQPIITSYGISFSQRVHLKVSSVQDITLQNFIFIDDTFTFTSRLRTKEYLADQEYLVNNGLLKDNTKIEDMLVIEPSLFKVCIGWLKFKIVYLLYRQEFIKQNRRYDMRQEA